VGHSIHVKVNVPFGANGKVKRGILSNSPKKIQLEVRSEDGSNAESKQITPPSYTSTRRLQQKSAIKKVFFP
jgi:hypothetical protein